VRLDHLLSKESDAVHNGRPAQMAETLAEAFHLAAGLVCTAPSFGVWKTWFAGGWLETQPVACRYQHTLLGPEKTSAAWFFGQDK
jgi:hypothetical protein